MKVHLVDGTFELFRAYYASPPATGPSGREVGAVRGLMRSLLTLLNEDSVSHIAIAFDHTVESFRNTMFEGYKTGEGLEPAVLAQFGAAEEASRALGITTWAMTEFEADDALATAAARFAIEPAVSQVLICSPDKDMAQCVCGREIVCVDRIRRKTLDERGVVAKFGVQPRSMPDWLALVGDAADGIPGIPRWGAKSAATVLAAYETIDAIPARHEDWKVSVRGAAALSANLEGARDLAALYRRLAVLRTDVPLNESLADLEWHGPDESGLASFAESIGDQQILRRAKRIAPG
jgi:5'-3' exonuclease